MIRFVLLALIVSISPAIKAEKVAATQLGEGNINYTNFCLSANRNAVYAVSGNTLRVFDLHTRKKVDTLYFAEEELQVVSISSDSSILVVGTRQGSAYIYDTEKGLKKKITISDFPLTSIDIDAHSSSIAFGDQKGSVYLVDKTGKHLDKLDLHTQIITALRFSADGSKMASSGMDGLVCITSLSGDIKSEYLVDQNYPCRAIAWSFDMKELVAGFDRAGLIKWTESENFLYENERQSMPAWVTGLDFHDKQNSLATCTSNGFLYIKSNEGMKYEGNLKQSATQVAFYNTQDKYLNLIVSVYKRGLLLVSAKNMVPIGL